MKKSITILCILTSFFCPPLPAEPIITFFIEPYTLITPKDSVESITDKLQQPRTIAKYALRQHLPTEAINAGIFGTYAGFLTATDTNGQIMFPSMQRKPAINLLITPSIEPVIMFGNTLSHWKLTPKAPAIMYRIERKSQKVKKPERLEVFYWQAKKIDLPKNGRIPFDTVVLFEKPNHIYLPLLEGVEPTTKNPNLIIPTIYIKKHTSKLDTALETLSLREFFSGLSKLYQKEPLNLRSQLQKRF